MMGLARGEAGQVFCLVLVCVGCLPTLLLEVRLVRFFIVSV